MATCKKLVLSTDTLFRFSLYCLLVTLLFSPTSAFAHRPIPARGDTLIESAIADDATSPTTEHQCQFCCKKFDSRNALFRHLKTDQKCSSEFLSLRDKIAGKENSQSYNFTRKQSLLLKISYSLQNQRDSANDSSGDSSNSKASAFCWKVGCENTSDAYEIGQKVQEAIEISLLDKFGGRKSETTTDDTQNKAHSSGPGLIIGTTQTSAANHRPSVLAQENGISSAADFLLANIRMPQGAGEGSIDVDNLMAASRILLGDDVKTSSGAVYNVTILNAMRLPKDFPFHAEKDCTQRVYHYLLPLSWLPDGSFLESWCQNYDDQSKPAPPSNALARLREALQLAESTSIPNRKVRRRQRSTNDSDVMATPNQSVVKKIRKASASLNRKERIPWHNFGHVELRGDASPNQEPVWNVLDRARIKGFLLPSGFDQADETLAVLEFRGDSFVPGQIQGIVGTAVAVLHGWLPSDIFATALSNDFLLETPSAPKHRLYCAGARFHSHESKLVSMMQEEKEEKVQTFDVLEYGHPKTAWQATQEQVLQRLRSFGVSGMKNDKKWLEELQHSLSPRIKKAMVRLKEQNLVASRSSSLVADKLPTIKACVQEQWVTAGRTTQDDTALVQAYHRTLHLLREIVATGSWPETSMARSNVIREECTSSSIDIDSTDLESRGRNGGSFTVFNMQVTCNPLLESITPTQESPDKKEEMNASQKSLPLGNQKFPDLVEAVFELERVLSESGMLWQRACLDGSLTERNQKGSARSPSLCCAINANASFLPHVDSGRGTGQSLSLIVGLGDYDNGGEIRVEDFSHDIRYTPLEFDGWLSRHWTQPYRGERFSLVWFSPAT
ncbi:MAG: hypothetical protein SGBAC_008952 [Bacillariaceae sp.]